MQFRRGRLIQERSRSTFDFQRSKILFQTGVRLPEILLVSPGENVTAVHPGPWEGGYRSPMIQIWHFRIGTRRYESRDSSGNNAFAKLFYSSFQPLISSRFQPPPKTDRLYCQRIPPYETKVSVCLGWKGVGNTFRWNKPRKHRRNGNFFINDWLYTSSSEESCHRLQQMAVHKRHSIELSLPLCGKAITQRSEKHIFCFSRLHWSLLRLPRERRCSILGTPLWPTFGPIQWISIWTFRARFGYHIQILLKEVNILQISLLNSINLEKTNQTNEFAFSY